MCRQKKPAGAGFYPEDMTKAEFEAWVKTLPRRLSTGRHGILLGDPAGERETAERSLQQEYKAELAAAAGCWARRRAATSNATLEAFLDRAAAFLSNDYYESDVAWMDLDAPIDITIGPYETYNDELFGYKAAFEAYINLRDDAETDKVSSSPSRLQEIENNLPMEPEYRNPKIGALAPIRVVNEIYLLRRRALTAYGRRRSICRTTSASCGRRAASA